MEIIIPDQIQTFVVEYWPHIGGISAIAVTGISTAIYSFIRRPKSSTAEAGPYFSDTGLLSPPLARPAYSDRMAYVLSEMASLAYYQFEGERGLVDDAISIALEKNLTTDTNIREFLEYFTTELMSGDRCLGQESMKKLLANSGFSLLNVINIGETQGFVCKRTVKTELPYLVLAFRGTEKKMSDWLTDVRCIPTVDDKSKIHTGFLEAFTKNKDAAGKTVKDAVEKILTQRMPRMNPETCSLFSLRVIRWAAHWHCWQPGWWLQT